LEKNLQSQALVGDFGGSCIHRSSRQRKKAIEMLQFFRAVSALTVSMDLIDCFWRKAVVEVWMLELISSRWLDLVQASQ
jgi:hypothetical protein